MAKSNEEKALNKEASLLKKSAHSARVKELRAAEKKAEDMVNAGALAAELAQARLAEDAAFKLRKKLIDNVRAEIALLQDKMNAISAEHYLLISAAHLVRNEIYSKFYAEKSRAQKEVLSNFTDLDNDAARWSSAGWEPPSGYIEKFAAANAGEIAKKKARRDKKRDSAEEEI